MKQITEEAKTANDFLSEHGINTMTLNDDFNTALFHAMERYAEYRSLPPADVRAVAEGKFYKLIADYIGNTQPVGYTFKSVIGEYYDKYPANFCRISEQEYQLSTLPQSPKQ